jgi:choline transport protein
MIPIAILGTVAIGCVTSWTYSVAMFFSIQDLQALLDTKTGVPILELFYQAVRSRGAAVALEGLILVTGMGCLVASHTWQSRLCWSFARDNGLPFSGFLSQVDDKLGVPFNAHLVSCLIVSVLGFLYLGSVTAFNSMAAACIVLLYVSYSIPIFCLLVKGRENVRHGPFWLGWVGKVANWVLLGWTVFTFVMYSFPPVMPVKLGNMNYVCVVYGVVFAGVVGWWHVEGKRSFKERGGLVEVVQDEVVR